MAGKKISDLDIYDDINTDKSRRDLFEVSKNTGTYGSPTYATNGSRKITVEQLKETLNIQEGQLINGHKVCLNSTIPLEISKVNYLIEAGTWALPTPTGSGKLIGITASNSNYLPKIVTGSQNGDYSFNKQNETVYYLDLTTSSISIWLELSNTNKDLDKICPNLVTLIASTYTAKPNDSIRARPQINYSNINITINQGVEGQCIYIKNESVALGNTYTVNLIGYYSHSLSAEEWILIRYFGIDWEVIATNQNGSTTTNDITVGSITASNTTVSTLPFIDSAKKIISATGVLLGTWFQTLTADTNPVDADTIVVNDSTASFEAKRTTLVNFWTNYLYPKILALFIKKQIGTYADRLALTGVADGDLFYQTDMTVGLYLRQGGVWVRTSQANTYYNLVLYRYAKPQQIGSINSGTVTKIQNVGGALSSVTYRKWTQSTSSWGTNTAVTFTSNMATVSIPLAIGDALEFDANLVGVNEFGTLEIEVS